MRAHHQPDSRTAILVLLVANALVMGRNNMTISLICLAIAIAALVTTGRWRFLAEFLGTKAGRLILFLVLPHLWQNGFVAFLALIEYWMFKLTTAGGIASYLVMLVRSGQSVAALCRMRIPITATMPVIVLLRFIPTVLSEYHAVREAMTLRGLPIGWRAWIHPLRFLEFVLVPLLASCTRIADEMTVAGMVRGLGSKQQPMTLSRLGLSGLDALWILIAVGLAVSTWWLKDLPVFPGGSL